MGIVDKFLLQKEDSQRRVNKANHEGEQQGSPYPVNVAPTKSEDRSTSKVDDYHLKEWITARLTGAR